MPIHCSSVNATYEAMKPLLSRLVPDFELKLKAELVFEINRLKKEKNALILGHNYMEAALFHTVPDIVGDSLQLSRAAAESSAQTIIMCGVRFMAESAKILCPHKTVLLPAKKAGCSLASSISAENVKTLKQQYPGVTVVTYINTYADVKAETDIVCTSSNAAKVVNSLKGKPVIFLPDEYLAQNVARECGREILFTNPQSTTKHILGPNSLLAWNGRCEVHELFSVNDIKSARKQFPQVQVLSHPECSPDVVAASDFSASTTRMVQYVKESKAPQYLILTECAMGDNIIAENPDKEILRLCSHRCPHMGEITLEDTLDALKKNQYEIEVPEAVRIRAKGSLDRMLEIQ